MRRNWKGQVPIWTMMVCSQLGVRPESLRGYQRFAGEVKRGRRVYSGLMLETHVQDLVEKYVKRGKVRKVLCEIATQVFNISPSVLAGVG